MKIFGDPLPVWGNPNLIINQCSWCISSWVDANYNHSVRSYIINWKKIHPTIVITLIAKNKSRSLQFLVGKFCRKFVSRYVSAVQQRWKLPVFYPVNSLSIGNLPDKKLVNSPLCSGRRKFSCSNLFFLFSSCEKIASLANTKL